MSIRSAALALALLGHSRLPAFAEDTPAPQRQAAGAAMESNSGRPSAASP